MVLNNDGLKINWKKCYIPWNKNTGANILLGFAIRKDGFAIPKSQQEKILRLTKTDPLKAA